MDRKEVYEIVDSERDYQNKLNPQWNHGGKASVGEELLIMHHYLNQAMELWTTSYGNDKPPLEKIRSVIACGVRCLENHGGYPREKK